MSTSGDEPSSDLKNEIKAEQKDDSRNLIKFNVFTKQSNHSGKQEKISKHVPRIICKRESYTHIYQNKLK